MVEISKEKIKLPIERLETNSPGLRVARSIESGFIRSSAGNDLKLRSARKVSLQGPKYLDLSSFGGKISGKALDGFKIQGQRISLEAGEIIMKNIQIAHHNNSIPHQHHHVKKLNKKESFKMSQKKVFSLCVCKNGKVFISDGKCAADYQVC